MEYVSISFETFPTVCDCYVKTNLSFVGVSKKNKKKKKAVQTQSDSEKVAQITTTQLGSAPTTYAGTTFIHYAYF